MDVGELISLYRKQSGMTIDELALRSGVPKGTLNKIIGGVTKAPTLENMRSIAHALGKRLSDFDDGPKPEDFLTLSEQNIVNKYRVLDNFGQNAVIGILENEYKRCIEQAKEKAKMEAAAEFAGDVLDKIIPFRRSYQPASAGTGIFLGPDEFETIYVLENNLTRRASFGVPVSGNSMEPDYHDGDVLLVERAEDVRIGEVGVFTIDGDGYVKQRGEGELISLNPAYDPIPMNESIRCSGRVIGILEPDWIVEK